MPLLNDMTLTDAHEALSQVTLKIGNVTLNPLAIIKSIVVILILLWVVGLALRILDRRLRRIKGMRTGNRVLILKLVQVMLYCIVFLAGMQMLGISLTALSVFGGALGVGLGFGLQKIASNFISGIILLFEKSLEVGDLIELSDGTTGFLRESHARYTLIEAFDGREILIPNEEFINTRVTSWTHNDRFGRAMIVVSVAYDADLELAKKLMLDAATSHPKCSNKRPPMCVLDKFADSGIEFNLYFWVSDVTDGRLEPRSEIMFAIHAAFKAHGIVIPYPQRDVRVINTTPDKAIIAAGDA